MRVEKQGSASGFGMRWSGSVRASLRTRCSDANVKAVIDESTVLFSPFMLLISSAKNVSSSLL